MLIVQVVPRGEVPAVGGQDDHLDVVVLRPEVEGVVQLVEHPDVLRVVRLRSRQHDPQDVVRRTLDSNPGVHSGISRQATPTGHQWSLRSCARHLERTPVATTVSRRPLAREPG